MSNTEQAFVMSSAHGRTDSEFRVWFTHGTTWASACSLCHLMLVEPKRGPPCSQVLCLQALSSTQLTSVAPCPCTHPGLARLGSFSRIPWVLSGSLASHCTLTRFSCPGFGPEPLIFPQKAVGKNLPTVISGHLPQPLLYSRGSAAHLQATSQDTDFPAPTKQSACPSRRLPSHCPAQPPGGQ